MKDRPPDGVRAARKASGIEDPTAPSDRPGVLGLFAFTVLLVGCCLALPALLAGTLTLGAALGYAPWVLGPSAALITGWMGLRVWRAWRGRARVPAAKGSGE